MMLRIFVIRLSKILTAIAVATVVHNLLSPNSYRMADVVQPMLIALLPKAPIAKLGVVRRLFPCSCIFSALATVSNALIHAPHNWYKSWKELQTLILQPPPP